MSAPAIFIPPGDTQAAVQWLGRAAAYCARRNKAAIDLGMAEEIVNGYADASEILEQKAVAIDPNVGGFGFTVARVHDIGPRPTGVTEYVARTERGILTNFVPRLNASDAVDVPGVGRRLAGELPSLTIAECTVGERLRRQLEASRAALEHDPVRIQEVAAADAVCAAYREPERIDQLFEVLYELVKRNLKWSRSPDGIEHVSCFECLSYGPADSRLAHTPECVTGQGARLFGEHALWPLLECESGGAR